MAYFTKYQHHHRDHQSRNYHSKSVPAWEKQFCYVVGRMLWKYFLEAKKYALEFTKIMQWDDSAGKKSFCNAKNRFWAKNGGPPYKISLPSPDMYIDQIDWDAKLDPQLFLDLEAARNQVQDYKEEKACVLLEDIKPTGWDIDCQDWNKPIVLTGMIVGDKGSFEDGKNGEVLKDTTLENLQGNYYKRRGNHYQGGYGSSSSGDVKSRYQEYQARTVWKPIQTQRRSS